MAGSFDLSIRCFTSEFNKTLSPEIEDLFGKDHPCKNLIESLIPQLSDLTEGLGDVGDEVLALIKNTAGLLMQMGEFLLEAPAGVAQDMVNTAETAVAVLQSAVRILIQGH